jgi:hypothetical protein
MARGTPKVRAWRVNYWNDGRIVWNTVVDAPTRQFALWAGQDAYRAMLRRDASFSAVNVGFTTVTAGVIKE